MLRFQRQFVTAMGTAAALAAASTAQAQLFGRGCDCGTPIQSASFHSSAVACQTVMQPVAQSCYQTVAVTEYTPVKQVTRRPKMETRIVNQDVIEYRPETQINTCEVPTVSYQNVTEYQQVCKNVAYVQTNVSENVRPSPCEYDNRRTLAGYMNRTAYEFRSMFVPRYNVQRQVIPQTVMQTVPVTRRVAVHGTKQVSYQTTKMVATRSTRQVAMNHMTYEDVETTVNMPRTVMRQVPIGVQSSFVPSGPSSSSLSLTPIPDSTASRPTPLNSAKKRDAFDSVQNPENYKEQPIQPKANKINYRPAPQDSGYQPQDRVTKSKSTEPVLSMSKRNSPPSAVRLNKWVARTPTLPEGPTSDLSVADVDR